MKIKLLNLGPNPKDGIVDFAVLNKKNEALTIVQEYGRGYKEGVLIFPNIDFLNRAMVARHKL